MVDTFSLPDSGANPGACAANDHGPDLRPMIEKRPLSSVVAVKLLGDRGRISARWTVGAFDRSAGLVLHDAADAARLSDSGARSARTSSAANTTPDK